MLAIEERDGVRFYVDRTSPLSPIQLIRTPGFGGNYLPDLRMPTSCSSPSGAPPACARPTPSWPRRCGGRARRSRSRRRGRCASGARWRAIELAWARLGARGAAADRGRRRGRSSTRRRPRRCWRRAPGAIRFDAPAAGNRPGRHGLWQRPVERRRLRERAAARAVERGRAGRGARRRTRTRSSSRCPVRRAGPPASATSPRSPTAPTRRRRASTACWPRGPARVPRRRGARRGGHRRGGRRAASAGSRGCASPGDAPRDEYRALAAPRARVRDRAAARGLRDRAARGARRRLRARHDAARRAPTPRCRSRARSTRGSSRRTSPARCAPRCDDAGARVRRARDRGARAVARPRRSTASMADVLLPRLLDSAR